MKISLIAMVHRNEISMTKQWGRKVNQQVYLQGSRNSCAMAYELMNSFKYSQAMCRKVFTHSSDWWSHSEKEKRAKWSGLSVLVLIWQRGMDWLPDDWIDRSRAVNKRLCWSLITHDLLVNTAKRPAVAGGDKGTDPSQVLSVTRVTSFC